MWRIVMEAVDYIYDENFSHLLPYIIGSLCNVILF